MARTRRSVFIWALNSRSFLRSSESLPMLLSGTSVRVRISAVAPGVTRGALALVSGLLDFFGAVFFAAIYSHSNGSVPWVGHANTRPCLTTGAAPMGHPG